MAEIASWALIPSIITATGVATGIVMRSYAAIIWAKRRDPRSPDVLPPKGG